MRKLHDTGKPFLVSFMTVSNHKPYSYPKGRIPEDPDARLRDHAVKYADWALGDFFRLAKAEPFWKDTIFIVVGDHGARVYGSQTIPLQSYRVPFLVAGPCVVDKPQRIDTPGCQLDVTPTILGLIGRPYTSLFFGHNLLLPGATERNKSVMHHNRSIAIYRDSRQVVFGLNKSLEYWHGDADEGKMVRVSRDADFDVLQKDGTAMFVCADALYTSYRYILAQ
jgi:phosphoglycerol transferase MdoB-like AlkP superfamily enzyme